MGSIINIFIDALAIRRLTPEQREDLAFDPEDALTADQQARTERANREFDHQREEVKPQADEVWRRLTPAIDYMADHANLYAIKPLLIFDAAHLSTGNEPSQRTRLGVGGGVQFNLVVASSKLAICELCGGYPVIHFVVRMVFDKLF